MMGFVMQTVVRKGERRGASLWGAGQLEGSLLALELGLESEGASASAEGNSLVSTDELELGESSKGDFKC